MTLEKVDSKTVEDIIDLFLEYRDVHGYTEDDAKEKVTLEVFDCKSAEIDW